jgi:glycosyltransferase involved in cell wall biosynthesis
MMPSGKAKLSIHGTPQSPEETRYLHLCLRLVRDKASVRLAGAYAPQEVNEVLKGIHVLIAPSICHETYNLAVAEALAAGRPVIATRSGGPEDQIQHGINGALVAPNDPEALAQAMQDVIEDPERIQDWASKAKAQCSLDDHVRALEAVYEEAIRMKRREWLGKGGTCG